MKRILNAYVGNHNLRSRVGGFLFWTALVGGLIWAFGMTGSTQTATASQMPYDRLTEPELPHDRIARMIPRKPGQRGRVPDYLRMAEKSAREHGLDPLLVAAVIRQESNFVHETCSHKAACGLMQLIKGTAKMAKVNRFNPEQNIKGGCWYLKQQLDTFKDLRLALAAYNAGPENVRKYGMRIPPFPETQEYVRKVLGFYRDYKAAAQ